MCLIGGKKKKKSFSDAIKLGFREVIILNYPVCHKSSTKCSHKTHKKIRHVKWKALWRNSKDLSDNCHKERDKFRAIRFWRHQEGIINFRKGFQRSMTLMTSCFFTSGLENCEKKIMVIWTTKFKEFLMSGLRN